MQNLSSPPLVPSSMQSGGVLGDDKAGREQTAPGSTPVTGPPVPSQVSDQHLPEPASSNATPIATPIAVSDERPRVPQGHPSGKGGQFLPVTTGKGDDGCWAFTPAAG